MIICIYIHNAKSVIGASLCGENEINKINGPVH